MSEAGLRARALALLFGALASACAATFQEPRQPKAEHHSVWASYFVLGIIGKNDVDVRDHCRSGRASEIETGSNLATLGVSVLTIGIYTPRRVLVTCAPSETP